MNEIIYITSNLGKLDEAKLFFAKYTPAIKLSHMNLDIPEIQSLDQIEVVKDKAQKAWAILKKPLILDDFGIFIDGYNNFPGTLSKHVMQGIGYEGIAKLIHENHKAKFILQLAHVDEKGNINIFEGLCDGTIDFSINPQHFNPALPYTKYFKPAGQDKSYADLRYDEDFHRYSIRYKALKKLFDWYNNR